MVIYNYVCIHFNSMLRFTGFAVCESYSYSESCCVACISQKRIPIFILSKEVWILLRSFYLFTDLEPLQGLSALRRWLTVSHCSFCSQQVHEKTNEKRKVGTQKRLILFVILTFQNDETFIWKEQSVDRLGSVIQLFCSST